MVERIVLLSMLFTLLHVRPFSNGIAQDKDQGLQSQGANLDMKCDPGDVYIHSLKQCLPCEICVNFPNYPNCVNYTSQVPREIPSEQRLVVDLLGGYNKRLRPITNSSNSIDVYFTFKMKQIVDISERDQILKLNMHIFEHWFDEKLTWNPADYENIYEVRIPGSEIWIPDITLYNTGKSKDSDFMDKLLLTNAVLRHDGLVRIASKPFIVHSICLLDITHFPFDYHECDLKFGSWTYDQQYLDLFNATAAPIIYELMENEQWKMLNTHFVRSVEQYLCCPDVSYVDVTCKIKLRRKPLYYIYNLVMPIFLLSGLSMVGFWMPYSVAVVKASLCVTLILCLNVFMLIVAETMPRTSDHFPLIAQYYIAIMVLTSISTAMNVLILNIVDRGENCTSEVPDWLKVLTFIYLSKIVCMKLCNCAPESDEDDFEASRWKKHARKKTRHRSMVRSRTSSRSSLVTRTGHGRSSTHLVPRDMSNYSMSSQYGIHVPTARSIEEENALEDTGNVLSHNCIYKLYLKRIATPVDDILISMRTASEKTRREERILRDWQRVAEVIDRFMFLIYVISTISVTMVLLLFNPKRRNVDDLVFDPVDLVNTSRPWTWTDDL
ncbi:neuronal acetylcholine receptor subunit alpha-10-like isoform X2 [Antedon mediterranea]|uniref:neuronal acetylcholine receptor subunit alpha-10-like isoform X2 n=1 Tax=Antedon mediterranea TaxID=105859 RepID=UPI003AF7C85E